MQFGTTLASILCLAAVGGSAFFIAEMRHSGGSTSKVGVNPGGIFAKGPAHLAPSGHDQLASFSAGCFWGVEDTFRQVPGVVSTAVGYTGGHTVNPSYEQVCGHDTGHAESVLIEFDPTKVSYKKLLQVFWDNHVSTTPNRQGPDVGDNYRSAIWCYSPEQESEARASMVAYQKKLSRPIVTEIETAAPFYVAEDYHQQYDEKTGTHTCPVLSGS